MKDNWLRGIFIVLLLCALTVRGVVPAGFMPATAKDGMATLVICTKYGPKTIVVDPSAHPLSAQHDNNGQNSDHTAPPSCAFAMVLTDAPPAPAPIAAPLSFAFNFVYTPYNAAQPHSAPALGYQSQGPPV